MTPCPWRNSKSSSSTARCWTLISLKLFGLNRANFSRFLELAEKWDEDQKRHFIIAVGECGYSFDPDTVDPDDFDVDIYDIESLRRLDVAFVALTWLTFALIVLLTDGMRRHRLAQTAISGKGPVGQTVKEAITPACGCP
jgi:hypothetical protein